jgi:hypothetical protein
MVFARSSSAKSHRSLVSPSSSILDTMFFFLLLNLAALAVSLPTITIKGSKFFTSDGNQWFVKGIYLSVGIVGLTDQALRTSYFHKTPWPTGRNAHSMPTS